MSDGEPPTAHSRSDQVRDVDSAGRSGTYPSLPTSASTKVGYQLPEQ